MSGPTTYQIQPNKWIVPKPGGTHDPDCPNPGCPYKGSKPAPPLPLVKVDPKPIGGRRCQCSDCIMGGQNSRPSVTKTLPSVKPVEPSEDIEQLAELVALVKATQVSVNESNERSKANAQSLVDLTITVNQHASNSNTTTAPGPPGPSGPQGPPGVAGAPFKLSDATDDEVAAFALRLPPLTFQAYTPDDKPFGKPLVKRLGETVDILSLTGPFQSR